MAQQVARGSLWNLGGQGVTLVASFVATPLVIRWLGAEAYGVLTLINLLIGYLAFGDLGMGMASTRYGAEAHARGDDEGEATVIWTALLIGLAPVLVLAVLLVLTAELLLERGLHLPAALQPPATLALRIAALGFMARALSSVLNTPQLVRLRMRLNSLLTTGANLAQIIFTPIVLWCGGGLVGAVAVVAVSNGLLALVHGFFSLRLLPQLVRPRFDFVMLRSLARFGAALVASQLAALVLANGEKLVLARVASVKTLAHYTVAYTLANLLTMIPTALGQVLLPALTRLQASAARADLQRLYQQASRAILVTAPPLVVIMALLAQPFFTFWAGAEYGRESTGPFYLLLGGAVFNILAVAPLNLVLAAGKAELVARYYWLELLPYILCVITLTWWFGARGAALAWGLRVLTDAVLFIRASRQLSGLPFSPFASSWRAYFAGVLWLLLPLCAGKWFGWPPLWQGFVVTGALLSYGGLAYRVLLNPEDREWLRRQTRHYFASASLK
ncbi:MAG: flippase [Acidobacteria bacterium]|nr:flippase [Acidobacteriota bacterium]MBI3421416.1 flippase [Acidobacteriota bacterium]